MTTKGNFSLLFEDKQKNVTDNGLYSNLTLNKNYQISSNAFSRISKSVCTERRKVLDYADLQKVQNSVFIFRTKIKRRTAALTKVSDFTNDSQTKKESHSWNKLTKDLSSCVLKNCSGNEDRLKKEEALSASTLSLYIEAYENSNKANLCDVTKEGLIKKGLNAKHNDFDSTAVIQNAFEFSRQLKNGKASNPEIAQYRASQRLLNLGTVIVFFF